MQYWNQIVMFLAAEDGKALYSQQKQDLELTVAQIMTPYCKIQAQIEGSMENYSAFQAWTKSNPLWFYSEGDE